MKSIEGYESYFVNESGDVWSSKRNKYLTKSFNNGYAKVIIKVNGVHHNKLVHRLVAQAFIPNPENKPQVNHKDGVKTNNHVSNLEWNTASENNIHAHKIGLIVITEKCIANQKEAVGHKVIDTKTGITYLSVREACMKTDVNRSRIYDKLKGICFNDTNLKYLTK